MLKPLVISSVTALLLVGCAIPKTKPINTPPPAKVTQPATKAVKPVLKPNAAVKPQTTPVKAAEPVAVNSDVALGKQWASCAGEVQALYIFAGDLLRASPELQNSSRMKKPTASYRKLPIMRDAFYAYAQASSANPEIVATQYQQVYIQQYTQYTKDLAWLLNTVQQPKHNPVAFSTWDAKYSKQVIGMITNITSCQTSLAQEHSRFDTQVVPSLRYEVVNATLRQELAAQQDQKPSKKRSRKAS